jgi:hypothetical protein
MGRFNYNLISAVCIGALALSGCNGVDENNLNQNTPAPSAPTSTLSGTAAVGQAVSGAHVLLTCGGGHSYTATTNTGGVYSAKVRTDSLPCAASISGGTLPAGVTLHSVTTTNGPQVVLNITPLTDLALIKALQHGSVDASTWLAHPVATNLPDAAAIASATAALKAAFIAKGYAWPTAANFNPITSTLSPAVTTDLYDALLDALDAALTAAASDYRQLVSSFIGGGSLPTAPSTPPVTGAATCASIGKPKAALSDLAAFVGNYQVKIGSATAATTLAIAANGNITLKGQIATASDVCGPFVQANGQGLLILAAQTAPIQVNVFKDTAGKITTEGQDFTNTSGDNFFGEKGEPVVTPPDTTASKGILGKLFNTVLPGDYVLQCSDSPIGTPVNPVQVSIKADGTSTLNGQPLVDATHKGTSYIEYQRALNGTLQGVNLKIEQQGGNYALLSWHADGTFVPNSAFVDGQVKICYSHTGHSAPATSAQVVSSVPTIFQPLARSESESKCLGPVHSPNPGAQNLVLSADGSAQFGGDSFAANSVSKVTDASFLTAVSGGAGVIEYADLSAFPTLNTLSVSFDNALKTTSASSNHNSFLSCTP